MSGCVSDRTESPRQNAQLSYAWPFYTHVMHLRMDVCGVLQEGLAGGLPLAYEVVYNPDGDCVYASIEGSVDLAMAQRYAQEIINQLRSHGCLRLRNDMRKASVKLSTIDLYDLPPWIEERLEEAGASRSCRRALLVSRDLS